MQVTLSVGRSPYYMYVVIIKARRETFDHYTLCGGDEGKRCETILIFFPFFSHTRYIIIFILYYVIIIPTHTHTLPL